MILTANLSLRPKTLAINLSPDSPRSVEGFIFEIGMKEDLLRFVSNKPNDKLKQSRSWSASLLLGHDDREIAVISCFVLAVSGFSLDTSAKKDLGTEGIAKRGRNYDDDDHKHDNAYEDHGKSGDDDEHDVDNHGYDKNDHGYRGNHYRNDISRALHRTAKPQV
ncbi:hypothetical protein NQZ79_g8796 [Umbelopsis isabellina]|nr:hypothetical protein NQZ79_g8796 [Umbelopsis isabellina]